MMRYLAPVLVGLALLAIWEVWVSLADIPVFILPAPSAIRLALVENFASLMAALWVTVKVTAAAFFWAAISAIGLAIIFTRARLIEMALYPYVVTLQVTPVVAIAPLILIWVGFDNVSHALVMIIIDIYSMINKTSDPIISKIDGIIKVASKKHGVRTSDIEDYFDNELIK